MLRPAPIGGIAAAEHPRNTRMRRPLAEHRQRPLECAGMTTTTEPTPVVGPCPDWCIHHDTELGSPDSPATLHEHHYYGTPPWPQAGQSVRFNLRLSEVTAADPAYRSPATIMLGVDSYDQALSGNDARWLADALIKAADQLDQVKGDR